MPTQDKSLNSHPGFSGWEKWAILTVVIIGLAAIVAYFNLRVFGWKDGAPYIAVVAFIVLVSFLVTRHVRRAPVTVAFIRAAFVFDILLTVALAVSAAYSLSVMREMATAGDQEKQAAANLQTTENAMAHIGELKSPAAQRAAARALEAQVKINQGAAPIVTRAAVFAEHERALFWIMITELGIAMLATFVLLGLSVFDTDKNGVPDFLEKTQSPSVRPPAPPAQAPAPAYGEGKPINVWRGGKNIRPQ